MNNSKRGPGQWKQIAEQLRARLNVSASFEAHPLRIEVHSTDPLSVSVVDDTHKLRVSWEGGRWSSEADITKLKKVTSYRPIILSAPVELRLTANIHLPPLATTDVEKVTSLNFSTWTPFDHDEVYSSSKKLPLSSKRILLSIAYIRRSDIAERLSAAESLGFKVDAIAIGSPEYTHVLRHEKIARERRGHMVSATLIGMCLLGLSAAIAGQHRNATIAIDALNSASNELLPKLAQLAAAKKEASQIDAAISFARRHPLKGWSVSQIISQFASAIPPSAGIDTLDMTPQKVIAKIQDSNNDMKTYDLSALADVSSLSRNVRSVGDHNTILDLDFALKERDQK